MTEKPLRGKNIAILVASGFNETDMTEASRALITAGATLKTISVESGLINSWKNNGWGLNFMVDAPVNTVLAADFDMLFVPSGERSMTKLSQNPHAKRIMRGFMDAHKPVALQGDAVMLLAACERAEHFTVCGDTNQKDILIAAGASWSDESCHIDTHLLTGAGNETNAAFVRTMLLLFSGLENSAELLQDAA